ncbi:MAG TPA: hypothetical protein P5526_27395 [Anaerolineae bacterium]|nr:hypothetical protein [Anaerolineae bacterium]
MPAVKFGVEPIDHGQRTADRLKNRPNLAALAVSGQRSAVAGGKIFV